MNALFSALAVALVAFAVWLTVCLVNRRERWAKWVLAATLVIPVTYVASFGPACWLTSQPLEIVTGPKPLHEPPPVPGLMKVYMPIAQIASSESTAGDALAWYLRLGIPDGKFIIAPSYDDHFVLFKQGTFAR